MGRPDRVRGRGSGRKWRETEEKGERGGEKGRGEGKKERGKEWGRRKTAIIPSGDDEALYQDMAVRINFIS